MKKTPIELLSKLQDMQDDIIYRFFSDTANDCDSSQIAKGRNTTIAIYNNSLYETLQAEQELFYIMLIAKWMMRQWRYDAPKKYYADNFDAIYWMAVKNQAADQLLNP